MLPRFLCLWTSTGRKAQRPGPLPAEWGRAPAMHFSCLSPSLGVRGCLLNYSPGVRKRPRGTTLSLGLQVPGLCPCQAR